MVVLPIQARTLHTLPHMHAIMSLLLTTHAVVAHEVLRTLCIQMSRRMLLN